MALLKVEADKLSNNDLQRGVIEEIIDRDGVFNLLPFVRTEGKAYVYNRENALSEGGFIDVNEAIAEGAATYSEITAKLRILAGDVDVDKFLMGTEGDTNDQLGVQIALKAKALGRKLQRTMIIGDSAGDPSEFDGLIKLTDAGQSSIAGTNGAALTLNMLDQLADDVPNGPDVFFMHPQTIRAYKELLRTVGGGTDAAMLQMKNFTNPVLTHNGVPIVVNDFMPVDETEGSGTALTSVIAARFNELDGAHAIYGGNSAGIVLENIGTVQNKDAWRVRVKWYVGLVLKSTKSMAMLTAVDSAGS